MSDEHGNELRAHWNERYRSGHTPWDTGITPPEVQRFWKKRKPPFAGAYALDIGCGTGLNTLFLARQGLNAIGVDLAGQALSRARKRLLASRQEDPGLPVGGAAFVQADVGLLPVGELGAVYALDIGCLHSLPDGNRPGYAEGVLRALGAQGFFHLYAFDREASEGPGARGMNEGEVAALFGREMQIVAEEIGTPTSHNARRSRWYLLQMR